MYAALTELLHSYFFAFAFIPIFSFEIFYFDNCNSFILLNFHSLTNIHFQQTNQQMIAKAVENDWKNK